MDLQPLPLPNPPELEVPTEYDPLDFTVDPNPYDNLNGNERCYCVIGIGLDGFSFNEQGRSFALNFIIINSLQTTYKLIKLRKIMNFTLLR